MAARLRRRGLAVTVRAGTDPAASTRLAAEAVAAGTAVVVLGGAGLLHHVLPAVAGSGVPVGVVPAGTGNDAATAFGLPADTLAATDAVADAWADGHRTAAVDLGAATGDDGRTTLFATVLCWGFDAAVAELGARLPWPPGPIRYDLAIAAHTARLRHRPLTVALDDAAPTTSTALLVAVGNGGWYGGGKRMVPAATPDDGRLAVAVIGRVTRRELARLAPTLPRAGHVDHPAVGFHDATTVRLAAGASGAATGTATGSVAGPAAWADGERVGPLPLTVTTRPGALTLLRPRWCTPPAASRL